jgi:hypothetical protein
MANMGYCRFANTLDDLRDCYEHMGDQDLSHEEQKKRELMVKLCNTIVNDYGYEFLEEIDKE